MLGRSLRREIRRLEHSHYVTLPVVMPSDDQIERAKLLLGSLADADSSIDEELDALEALIKTVTQLKEIAA